MEEKKRLRSQSIAVVIPAKRPRNAPVDRTRDALLAGLADNRTSATMVTLLRCIDKADAELRDTSPINGEITHCVRVGTEILVTMRAELKLRLVNGTLFNHAARNQLLPVQERAPFVPPPRPGPKTGDPPPCYHRPVVYAIAYVDENGQPPRVDHLKQLLGKIEADYIPNKDVAPTEKSPFAVAVDAHMKVGKVAYDNSERKRRKGYASLRYFDRRVHLANATKWIEVSRTRLQGCSDNDRLPWTPTHVGYTYVPQTREVQHRTHQSSNTLMNLVDAASRVLFGDVYTMRYYVVYEIWNHLQTAIAEHVISHLAGAYIQRGGFNGACAGGNVGSSLRIELWVYEKLQSEICERPYVVQAIDAENAEYEKRRVLEREIADWESKITEKRATHSGLSTLVNEVNTRRQQALNTCKEKATNIEEELENDETMKENLQRTHQFAKNVQESTEAMEFAAFQLMQRVEERERETVGMEQ